MAFLNLSKIAESVESLFGAASKLFTGGSKAKADHPVSDTPDLAKITPENWIAPYDFSFSVATNDGEQVSDFIEFPLPIAPSNINMKEPIPTKTKATQTGTSVFRNGIKYRTISIQGTTGLYPKRSVYGVGSDGVARHVSNTGNTEGVRNASGFEAFMRLRNWFRAFYIFTKKDPKGLDYRLIFNNFKEGEFLVVELVDFSTKVDSSNPLLIFYDIQLKVLSSSARKTRSAKEGFLGALGAIDSSFANILDKIDGARAVFLGSEDILRQVDSNLDAVLMEPARKISMAAKSILNVTAAIGDIGPSIRRKFLTISLISGVFSKLEAKEGADLSSGEGSGATFPEDLESAVKVQGPELLNTLPPSVLLTTDLSDMPDNVLNAHEEERQAARNLPREHFRAQAAGIARLRDNAADAFGVGSSDYDSVEGRTSTSTPASTRVPSDREFELLAAFEQILSAFDDLLTSKEFFKGSYSERINSINEAFNSSLQLSSSEGVREYILPVNTTLEEVSLFELGDSVRWVEIAELNKLKSPYVVQDRTQIVEGVVAPGDTILIPSGGSDFGDIPIFRDSELLDSLTHLEKSMGIDLKLTSDQDIELSNTGDFTLATGLKNAVQAIVLRLLYEKGEVLEHPDLGVGLKVGSKTRAVTKMRFDLLDSLLSDPRFESIEDLVLEQRNNNLKIAFSLRLKNIDIPIPIELLV